MHRSRFALGFMLSAVLLAACGSGSSSSTDGGAGADLVGAAPPGDMVAAEIISGHCSYTNPFSQQPECREYVGSGWMQGDATKDCAGQQGSTFSTGACDAGPVLGRCIENGGTDKITRVLLPGTDASKCPADKTGCEVFAGGMWVPDAVCK